MREFVVDLTGVTTVEGFLAAFNGGFCQHVGGHLHTLNWNTFHDYLSWPGDERYRLVFLGWGHIRGVSRKTADQVFRDNPQAEVVIASALGCNADAESPEGVQGQEENPLPQASS